MEVGHVLLDTTMLRAAASQRKGGVHGVVRSRSQGGFLHSMISGNSAETPVQLSLSCSLIGEVIMLGGGREGEPGSTVT